MYKLRDYQQDAINAVEDFFEHTEKGWAMLEMGTGTGKTVVFSEFAFRHYLKDENVLVLTDKTVLNENAKQTLETCCNHQKDVLFPEYKNKFFKKQTDKFKSQPHIVISTMQTMSKDDRLESYPKKHFKYIIIDEAHHTLTNSYDKILKYFPDARVLGVTATPMRGDDQNLLDCDRYTIVYSKPLSKCVEEGYASTIKLKKSQLLLDPTEELQKEGNHKILLNDKSDSPLSRCITANMDRIADDLIRNCSNRKNVVFFTTVKQAQQFSKILKSKGAENVFEVDGEREDTNDEEMAKFRECKTGFIINVNMLAEGWDCPDVNCIINLAPTSSEVKYRQIVGRGTRLSPETGKQDCWLYEIPFQQTKFESSFFNRGLSFMHSGQKSSTLMEPYCIAFDTITELDNLSDNDYMRLYRDVKTLADSGFHDGDLFECRKEVIQRLRILKSHPENSDFYKQFDYLCQKGSTAEDVNEFLNDPTTAQNILSSEIYFGIKNPIGKLYFAETIRILQDYQVCENISDLFKMVSDICPGNNIDLLKEQYMGMKLLAKLYDAVKDDPKLPDLSKDYIFNYKPSENAINTRHYEKNYASLADVENLSLTSGINWMEDYPTMSKASYKHLTEKLQGVSRCRTFGKHLHDSLQSPDVVKALKEQREEAPFQNRDAKLSESVDKFHKTKHKGGMKL